MKPICGYQTTDGKFFDKEDDARKHQREVDEKERKRLRRLEMIKIIVENKGYKTMLGMAFHVTTSEIENFLGTGSWRCEREHPYRRHRMRKGCSLRPRDKDEAIMRAATIVDTIYDIPELDLIKHLL